MMGSDAIVWAWIGCEWEAEDWRCRVGSAGRVRVEGRVLDFLVCLWTGCHSGGLAFQESSFDGAWSRGFEVQVGMGSFQLETLAGAD